MAERIRWAILGTGKIGNRFAEALNNIPQQAQLWAVGSRNKQTAEAFGDRYAVPKRYDDYLAAITDPEVDIVYIGTPGVRHAHDIKMCLEAGKPVLCEKAFTINAAEARDVIGLARQNGLFLMEAMWTRFFPLHVRLRQLLDEGAIGQVNGLTANFITTTPYDLKNRFFDINLGAGVLLDLGSYGISFASSLFGAPIDYRGLATFGESGADYQAGVMMTFEGNKMAAVMSSQVSFAQKDAVVFGSEGKVVISEPWYKPTQMVLYRRGKEPQVLDFPLGDFNGYEYEALAVMECLRQGKTECEAMPLDESIRIMEVMDGLREQWGFKYPFEV